jgi:hypothetical protein
VTDGDAKAMVRAAVELAATTDLSVDDAFHLFSRAARLLESASIVRDMVAEERNEPLDHEDRCIWCGADRRRLAVGRPGPREGHDVECPWRRAAEWVLAGDWSPKDG